MDTIYLSLRGKVDSVLRKKILLSFLLLKFSMFFQVDMLKCLPSNGSLPIDPGYCLKCDSYCDLESSFAAVNRAWISITRHVAWF